ncbi:4-amino-4-deoxy-L-arabinose transferase [Nocardioides marmoriginsengisoli]|uniref:4-amino-4-deoxy-L-arabinose transferase n=1 Tax=Nocardioides marmoriginsengisoli TaxID=661483 RepID=A0A3N0CLT2_9ACTN|nr:4-amino-4-deoxy-L-arabinose transferase [Nocardioides marmoriginsengisoli]
MRAGDDPSARQILCIDGRAGTGKSTLAAELSAASGGITVVHTDDLLPGWGGLPRLPDLLAALVEPLAAGRPGSYPRYDWIAGRVAETVVVDPLPGLVIVEGVGAGCRSLRPWRTVLAWLETPTELRRTRALTRDGDTFAPYWDAWAEAELEYLRTDADRDAADLVLRT